MFNEFLQMRPFERCCVPIISVNLQKVVQSANRILEKCVHEKLVKSQSNNKNRIDFFAFIYHGFQSLIDLTFSIKMEDIWSYNEFIFTQVLLHPPANKSTSVKVIQWDISDLVTKSISSANTTILSKTKINSLLYNTVKTWQLALKIKLISWIWF